MPLVIVLLTTNFTPVGSFADIGVAQQVPGPGPRIGKSGEVIPVG